MKKLLRTLMLAVLFLPFALHAQTMYLTVADSTATNNYVPVYGNYMDDPLGSQSIYPASMLTNMVGENILSLSYYVASGSSNSWGTNKPMLVKLMVVTDDDLSAGYIDVTNATTVYNGTISAGDATIENGFTVDFTTPFLYTGGNLLVSFQINPEDVGGYSAISWYGKTLTAASRSGYGSDNYAFTASGTVRNFLPKTTFMYGAVPTCFKVAGLSVDNSLTTDNSLTLTWTDAINTGATYNLYNMADTTLIQGGITGLTYTVTGLAPNTSYAFGMQTDCGGGDIAPGYALTSGRTACGPTSLPWTCGFEADELQNTTQANAIPWCTQRFIAPADVSMPNYPYASTSYPHNGSRALYYYGTTATSYPDTMALILPQIDVTTYPMNNNRVTFWARSSSTSYDKTVYVYALNNATDFINGVLIDSVVVTGTTHTQYFIPMTTASATAPYVALMVRRGSGSLYLDDLVIEVMPACPEVTGLAVSNITAHGATLTWNGAADGYTIYEVTGTGTTVNQTVTTTTANITSLNSETQYTFGVTSNCGSDESPMVTISFTTLVSCPAPTALSVTYNPANPTEVALAWTENGEATAWQIALNGDETNLIDVTTNPYTLTNLILDSVYTVKVRANCGVGDLSAWSGTINFEPTTKTVIGSGSATNNYLPTYTFYNYSLTQQIFTVAELGDAGLIESIDFYNTGAARTRDLAIYIVTTPKDTFASNTDWISATAADLQYSGSVTFASDAWTTINLDGFVYDGSSNIAIIVDDNTGSYESGVPFCAFDATKQAIRVYNDNTNFEVTNPSYSGGAVLNVKNQIRLVKGSLAGCLKPSGVMISYTGGTDAVVTWNSDAPSFNINLNGTVTNNVTNPYTLSGLTLGTTYTVSVQAVCDATSTSDWTNPITFTTDACMPEDQCIITIVGADSYGDGWNGNAINVMQDGNVIGTFTIADGSSNTETYAVCNSLPVSFSWVAGSYPSEVSFEIQDGGNVVVFTGAGSSMDADSVFLTLTNACPSCLPATNLTVDDLSMTSVTISWTGTAASYDIYQDGVFVTNITANTYTFNGLTSATDYTFGVQSVCSASDMGTLVTITVATDCPDVTGLPYNEGFENGLGCWTTINASTDGQPWTVNNCSGLSTVNPHNGAYVASSWSWSSAPMHADAWLISPKFVLPNTTDSISFSWWDVTNASYPDHYSVVLSTTTKDTAAFTTVVYPNTTPAGDWAMRTIDLTPYAGQSVYIAFHHVDYDANFLLIDDIALYQGAYIPPAPDSLTVVFAVNDATMGTTVPAPGSYQYLMGDTVSFHPEANLGYHFTNWVMSAGGQTDTLSDNYVSVYFIVNGTFMSYGTVTLTALFEPDSTPVTETLTIHLAINDPTLGSITPAPGTYVVAVNDSLVLLATPNVDVNFDGWRIMIAGQTVGTLPTNPFVFPVSQQSITFGELTIMAMFSDSTSAPDSMTVIINTADATMGTTNPAPGIYHYAVGDQSIITAVPNNGYHLLYWIESMTIAGITETDTLIADTIGVVVPPMFAGVTFSITAYFEADSTPVVPCEAPTNLHDLEIPSKSDGYIGVAWDDNAGATHWNLQYKLSSANDWNNVVVNNNPQYMITGLEPLYYYDIRVQAICDENNLSEWSNVLTTFATGVGIDNHLENSVVLFPNPAKEYVDIRINGDVNVTSMEVYDVYGKLINTVIVVENPTRINVSNLADGMYFVRVTTEQGAVTKTFVKR